MHGPGPFMKRLFVMTGLEHIQHFTIISVFARKDGAAYLSIGLEGGGEGGGT